MEGHVTASVSRHPVRPLALLALAFAALALGPGVPAAGAKASATGIVATESNAVPNNTVLVFKRKANGRLTQRQVINTGGSGGLAPQPGCELPPDGTCPMLDTQGSVAITGNGRLIFAVNAGSDSITSLRRTSKGYKRIDVESSRGDFPESLTVHGHTLYVLNSDPDPDGNSGTIAGFHFTRKGRLTYISDSTKPVSSDAVAPPLAPRQIGFDRTGRVLVVSLLSSTAGAPPLGSSIDTFKVNRQRRPGDAVPHTPTTPLPFGFAFDLHNNLVMSQPSTPPDLAMDGVTATYDLNVTTGNLTPIETESSHGVAPCWVVVTRDGRYTYVVNTGGGAPDATVAGYRLSGGGALTFLGLTPENNANGDEFLRTDEALSRDSKFLYVSKPGVMGPVSQIDIYRVRRSGGLTLVGNTPANGPTGQSGLVAR
jgi:hypothetical protein